ncbi:hypothetical protein Sste5346_001362 [Sporothrix stenoceras]|uniref:Transmembrane protein n=1 Tax=Sporothrix stenoceras TaxID=5173 RepID=A0ABR3ZQD6_9PEZI
MAGYSAVQNFSLPSRSGTVRPFSPSVGSSSGHRSRLDRDNNSDPGSDLNLVLERNRIRSPTPTALQLFHFTDEENAARAVARRSRGTLPRPMSTSSSAPALTGAIDVGIAEDGGDDDITRVDHEPEIDHNVPKTPPKIKIKTGENPHLSLDPISPTLSVWPRPMSVLDISPDKKRNEQAQKDKEKQTASVRGQLVLSDGAHDNPVNVNVDLEANTNNSTYNEPPSLTRSISIRWGPRLRHISLSDVQAADDAARRVAAVRRERRVFWILVVLALLGVLSCTAAVTLSAAQAAMQVGVEEIGPDPSGGGPIWDVRTLAWLIASLVVCTAAAGGLAIATSARCRRRRDGNNGAYSPTEKAILTQLIQSGRRSVGESRCSHRFSTLFAHRPPQHLDADGNTRETRDSRAGWVEMDDMDDRSEAGTRQTVIRWWSLRKKSKNGLSGTDGANDNGEPVNVCDEDRNWAKFTQDPVQLRRYVEALEARLAVVDGVVEEGSREPTPIGRADSTNTRCPQQGVIRSPAMAVLPRESASSPTTMTTPVPWQK